MSEAIRQRICSMCSTQAEAKLDFVLNFVDEDIDFVSHVPVTIFPCLGKQ